MILVIQNSQGSCLTRKGLIGLWMKIPLNLWPGTIWPLNPSTLIRLELCICKSNRIINILCTKKSNRVPSQEILDSKGFCGIEPQSQRSNKHVNKNNYQLFRWGKTAGFKHVNWMNFPFLRLLKHLAQNSNLCISNPHIFSKCGLIRSNQPISTPS